MFGKGMYFYLFYCMCYEMHISTDMSKGQVPEKRDLDLNEEEDIRMDGIMGDHWRDVNEEGDDKKKIHALRWGVYVE